MESSVAFLTSVVVAEGREKGTEQLKEGRTEGARWERRRPSCCQLHARTPWSGREGKQVGLSKAFIPFYAEFPESSEESELVTSAALIFDGKPIVFNHVHTRFPLLGQGLCRNQWVMSIAQADSVKYFVLYIVYGQEPSFLNDLDRCAWLFLTYPLFQMGYAVLSLCSV